jgi:heavy metal translocating P-type ATPase
MSSMSDGAEPRTLASVLRSIDRPLLPLSIAALVVGIVAVVAGSSGLAYDVWTALTIVVAVRLGVEIAHAVRHGQVGVDLIAVLAMVGSVLLRESLPGAVIAVMITTGRALEAYADNRARRELAALLARSPRVVHRYGPKGLTSPPIESVVQGDRLLVKPGEVVPVDGTIVGEPAILDESALTGESRPATHEPGDQIASGTVNAGGPFDLISLASAEASTYAGIIRLVASAASSKAPFVRLADRFALLFLPLTFGIAGIAWLASGDPVRALAVLVVATPCPLILAAPIAIVSGISRAAGRGIIVKGGGALESLARASVVLFDKTGTLTSGTPTVAAVESFGSIDPDELLRLAASLEQLSPHVFAGAVVHAAHEHRLTLDLPEDVTERAGSGVTGRIANKVVQVGLADWIAGGRPLPPRVRELHRRTALEGSSTAFVGVGGSIEGALILTDPIRVETPRALRLLRRAGIRRIVMVTGDSPAVAETVGSAIGVDAILAERTPAEKLETVAVERADAHGLVVMVGDGINDAPSLAAADVGVAMGARGATAASEAADIVIVVDRLDRLAEAILIARRSRRIALESVVLGIGLSVVAMIAAAFGLLPPVAGAVLQELIDVAVILNALRALGGDRQQQAVVPGWAETGPALHAAHLGLHNEIERLRRTADRLDELEPAAALTEVREIRDFLVGPLLSHERFEDRTVYPSVASAAGDDDATAPLSRTHREIFHLIGLFSRQVDELTGSGPDDDDLRDLRRVLYSLNAILVLHMAQEDELYQALGEGTAQGESAAVTTGSGAPTRPA